MDTRKTFAFFVSAVTVSALICAMPSLAFAAGTEKPEKNAPEPKPRPDVTTKVYTNDDLGWHAATPARVSELEPGETQGGISVAGPSSLSILRQAVATRPPVNSDQNPQWYGEQLNKAQAQLAAVENREAQLLAFRESGSTDSTGPAIGLVLNAPCEGITTDNLISQLDGRREEISEQIDNLEDAARTNGLPSGVVGQASTVAAESQPSADERRAQLTSRYQQLSGALAETQAVTEDMQNQAASQGITLIPPAPGNGGNMTTDLIERLDSRAANIRNELSNVEDDALSLDVQPGDLR